MSHDKATASFPLVLYCTQWRLWRKRFAFPALTTSRNIAFTHTIFCIWFSVYCVIYWFQCVNEAWNRKFITFISVWISGLFLVFLSFRLSCRFFSLSLSLLISLLHLCPFAVGISLSLLTEMKFSGPSIKRFKLTKNDGIKSKNCSRITNKYTDFFLPLRIIPKIARWQSV